MSAIFFSLLFQQQSLFIQFNQVLNKINITLEFQTQGFSDIQSMKKFKKSLAINVPQDSQAANSPIKTVYKDKKRPLLLFNEHTVTSSANNQDQIIDEQDRQLATCQQFVQFHPKNSNEQKNLEAIQTEQMIGKSHKYKKFNVIQFEEFSIQVDKNKSYIYSHSCQNTDQKQRKSNQRQFYIQIPENQQENSKIQLSNKFSLDSKNENLSKIINENFSKSMNENLAKSINISSLVNQPPGPSNKSKMSKTLNHYFIFPTNDEQIRFEQASKKQKTLQKVICKLIPEQQHQKKIKQLNIEWNQKLDNITKTFEKERQQFYKEKSNLEKDLMIKDGQIQMLQKLITSRYSPQKETLSSNPCYLYNNHQKVSIEKINTYKSSMIKEKQKTRMYIFDEKIQAMETILLEKDLQINSLLEKINQFNCSIQKKNHELQELRMNFLKIQNLNESLRTEIFIYEKKQKSQKLSKNFYKMKQSLTQIQQESATPKGFSRSKWLQEISVEKQKQKQPDKNQLPVRGIDDLHKRLESLKINRIQLQNRGRIKSQIGYPQTSKHKTKNAFDFQGKYYDREQDFINQSRMY